jgi:membrane protease YdiL (CAAX protease family)
MAYAFSWIISIPIVLSEWGYLPEAIFVPLFAIKPFVGPFLAGFWMTRITQGQEGVRRLRRSMLQGRAGWLWYVFVLLVIPVLFIIGILVQPGALASFKGFPPHYLITYLVNFMIILLLGGPLGEEPGWRGFALPRVQRRYGALGGNLLLGVVWAFWHLPDFLTRAQGGGPGTGWSAFYTNLPIFVVMVMAITVVMSWVYNNTEGSLLIAILLHASINTGGILPELFPVQYASAMTLGNIGLLIGVGIPAVLILLFTRGRMGYWPRQHQAVD